MLALKISVYIPESKNIRDVLVLLERDQSETELIHLENGDILFDGDESIIIKRFTDGKRTNLWCDFEFVESLPAEKNNWVPIVSEKFMINNSKITTDDGHSFRYRTKKDEDPNVYYSDDRIAKNTNFQKSEDLIFQSQRPPLRKLFWLVMGNIALTQLLTE